ncbi:hypothetical protein BK717_09410 [Bacillus thuringiensis serovar malayensis]|nr:hypothetical protein BK717_09410 [Bacillus thuringiensis serovar malayensis]
MVLQETIQFFLKNTVDIGSITVYNELQQIFDSGLHPNKLNIFLYESYGVGMLEDTLIVREDWLDENYDLAKRAVQAIIQGWQHALLHQREAIDIVMQYVDKVTTTRELQKKMLQVIANYISPPQFSICKIGEFILPHLQHTANLLYHYNLISKPANIQKAIDVTIP